MTTDIIDEELREVITHAVLAFQNRMDGNLMAADIHTSALDVKVTKGDSVMIAQGLAGLLAGIIGAVGEQRGLTPEQAWQEVALHLAGQGLGEELGDG